MRFFGEKSRVSQPSGFSLIELSIVVVILSIISVLGLEVAVSFISTRAYDATKDKLTVLDRAIRDFYWVYGRLPCPADRTLSPYDTGYGLENCSLTPITTAAPVTETLGGSVPFRTLNLQPAMGIDSYNTRINYFVTRALTSSYTDFSINNATLEIRSGRLRQPCATDCVTLATDAAYALFSNGADKRGARTRQGVAANACTGTNDQRIDSQNCIALNGGSMNPSTIPLNVLYDSRYNAGSQTTNYFDDVIIWRKRGQL